MQRRPDTLEELYTKIKQMEEYLESGWKAGEFTYWFGNPAFRWVEEYYGILIGYYNLKLEQIK